MKNTRKLLILTAALCPLCGYLRGAESEVLSSGVFDAGRVRTNLAVNYHSFTQWNGLSDYPGHVGWEHPEVQCKASWRRGSLSGCTLCPG